MNLSRLFHCSVIKVLCSLSLRQLLYFIKSICLCQQLFYFSLLSFQATACLSYHRRSALSTTFFLLFFQQLSYIIMYPSACQQLFSFFYNCERRRRDLNPRAAINDLHPFQGCPFSLLGTSAKSRCLNISKYYIVIGKPFACPTERVGFEPTRPCGQTVFKTASL